MNSCREPSVKRRRMNRGDTYLFSEQIFLLDPPCGPEVPPTPYVSVPISQNPCVLGSPQDITGWFLWFTAKYHPNDPDTAAVIALTSALNAGIVLTDAGHGIYVVTDVPASTSGLPAAVVPLYFDLQAKDVTGRIFTLDRGILEVRPDVTRAIT